MIKTAELLNYINQKRPDGKEFSPMEQMGLLTKYFAEHYEDTMHDDEVFSEAVYAARQSIIESIVKMQEETGYDKNLFEPPEKFGDLANEEENGYLSYFIKEPISMLRSALRMIADMAEEENKVFHGEEELKKAQEEADLARMAREEQEEIAKKANTIGNVDGWLDELHKVYPLEDREKSANKKPEELQRKYDKVKDQNPNVVDIHNVRRIVTLIQGKELDYERYAEKQDHVTVDRNNLTKSLSEFGGDEPVKQALNKCKASFFEKMFGTTSKEYREFEKAFNDRQNGKDVTRDTVDEKAKAYLKLKIPGYKGEGLPDREAIEQLSGKTKDRALLALKTLEANAESRIFEQNEGEISENAARNVHRIENKTPLYNGIPYDFQQVIDASEKAHAVPENAIIVKSILDDDYSEDNNLTDMSNDSVNV